MTCYMIPYLLLVNAHFFVLLLITAIGKEEFPKSVIQVLPTTQRLDLCWYSLPMGDFSLFRMIEPTYGEKQRLYVVVTVWK